MLKAATVGTIQAEWSFDFAAACQRFAGQLLVAEPDQFIRATEEFAGHVPLGLSSSDRVALRDRLLIATQKAAQQFHRQFHGYVPGPCRSSPVVHSVTVAWDDLDDDPRLLVVEWAARFLDDFNTAHTWPAPIRAARIVRRCFQKPLNVRIIAREAGCSRSGLIRGFGRAFSMSMRNYQTRCRLRMAVTLLREPDSKVATVALDVGYRSAKNFYWVLRKLTGMTPSRVRGMSNIEAAELLTSRLSLPQPFEC